MYWGRYYNADPEDTRGKNRDRGDEEKAAQQAELDAKQLFRVAKQLDPPTDVFIRTLIRRSPKQREATKNTFKEQYELDLAEELKKGLGKMWYVLIEALLPESSDKDDKDDDKNKKKKDDEKGGKAGPEEALHAAVKKKDVPGAVKIICENENQLADLKDNYQKEYSTSVESDLEDKTKDPEKLFLLTLLKEKQNDGRKGATGVQDEATAIFEQGDRRWSSASGEFMRLLETNSFGHMRAVLKKYEQVSNGTTAIKAIEKECSKNYAKAVEVFLTTKGKSGEEGGNTDDGTEHAVEMYKNMNPENPKFVNLLVERAEVDMPTVRKAYKKKYKTELPGDLEERSRHPTVPCLLELIMKNPPSQGKDQGKKKGHNKHHDDQGQKKGHDKRQEGGQGQGQGQGQKDNNPLGQSNKRAQADSKKTEDKKKGDAKADADAEKLHKAMEGLGTDEDTILDIIIKKSNAQRQALKKKYKEKYKKDLAEDIQSELSGDFEEVILGLLMPPVDYDAHCLNKAVKGLGTNEAVLIGILCTANPKELAAVKEKYKKTYGEDLDKALKGDTSGGFADLLLALSKGERDQGTSVNDKEAKEDAQKLFKGKKSKLDLNDETFKELMTQKNNEQVKATFAEYKKLSGKNMEDAIKDAASGDARDGYLALLAAQDDPVTFYADSLQKAFKGMGTNDEQLIRIVVSRSEVDLPAIKAKFQERHKKSLKAAIESETSGDYRKALIKIVEKK
ncbi:annexin A6-like [Littorina saxatilis]|uniref:annexin A6-like n=1 Tax=Littorina saxatilis TaxID=31220 RepID=UPI0038B42C48